MSEKSLPPSEKRLRDARAKGNVARSEPLGALLVLAASTELLFWGLDAACQAWLDIAGMALEASSAARPLASATQLATACARLMVPVVACIGATAFAASVCGAWMAGSIHFSLKVLAPSLARLDPLAHCRQLVSARHLTALAISLISAAALGIAATLALADRLQIVPTLFARQSLSTGWQAGVETAHFVIRVLLAALAVPAFTSVWLAKRHHRRALRMSHRDMKEELKQTAGDPQVRARLRSALIEALLAPVGPALGAPRSGRALVTNPEHIAVMLHYDAKTQSVPVVIAKGVDEAARQMIEAAHLTEIPVFHFRKLARRLHADVELEATIPADCYRAVAVVYRLVDELDTLDARCAEPIEIDDLFFDERAEV
jgi:flagellar biosynthesis protein FlhB